MIKPTFNKHIAALTTRLLLGIIFFMQGYGKVINWGLDRVYSMAFSKKVYTDILPEAVLYFSAYYTSYAELFGGFLLLIGFKKNYALYALALVLLIVSLGHGLVEPIWDLSHVMYRAILLIALLIFPKEWDKFSLDYFLENRKTNN